MSPSKVLWLKVNVFEVLFNHSAIASKALKIVIPLIFDDHLHGSSIFIANGEHKRLSLESLLYLEPELYSVILNDSIYLERLAPVAILPSEP